ncbi:MAG: hypothetical protein Q9M19_00900, partial [Mariprofundaceae bacterium]|nr:hypothetical protein [Mariprofundaceae bacterium]
ASSKARVVPKPNNWSGVAAGMRCAKQAIETKDLKAAEQHLREVLEFAPAEAEAWHILAAVLNRQGVTDEAKDCLRRMQKLSKKVDDVLPASQRMAKLLWAQGEQEAAMVMLNQLLEQSPDAAALLSLQQQWGKAV